MDTREIVEIDGVKYYAGEVIEGEPGVFRPNPKKAPYVRVKWAFDHAWDDCAFRCSEWKELYGFQFRYLWPVEKGTREIVEIDGVKYYAGEEVFEAEADETFTPGSAIAPFVQIQYEKGEPWDEHVYRSGRQWFGYRFRYLWPVENKTEEPEAEPKAKIATVTIDGVKYYAGKEGPEAKEHDFPPADERCGEYFERKHDQGKTRWDLLPWRSLEGVAEVLTFGAEKYEEDSWRDVPDACKRYFSAMMRHRAAMERGETIDPESGKPHRFHFLCNAAFICEMSEGGSEEGLDRIAAERGCVRGPASEAKP